MLVVHLGMFGFNGFLFKFNHRLYNSSLTSFRSKFACVFVYFEPNGRRRQDESNSEQNWTHITEIETGEARKKTPKTKNNWFSLSNVRPFVDFAWWCGVFFFRSTFVVCGNELAFLHTTDWNYNCTQLDNICVRNRDLMNICVCLHKCANEVFFLYLLRAFLLYIANDVDIFKQNMLVLAVFGRRCFWAWTVPVILFLLAPANYPRGKNSQKMVKFDSIFRHFRNWCIVVDQLTMSSKN